MTKTPLIIPSVGSRWRNRGSERGEVYTVLNVLNLDANGRIKSPVKMIIYSGTLGSVRSLAADVWAECMSLVEPEVALRGQQ